jgi:hypothetical protein
MLLCGCANKAFSHYSKSSWSLAGAFTILGPWRNRHERALPVDMYVRYDARADQCKTHKGDLSPLAQST